MANGEIEGRMISKRRVLSAAIVLLIAFGTALFAPPVIYIAVVCLVAFLAFNEFLRMYRINENISLYYTSIVTFIVLCIMCFFPSTREPGIGLTVAPLGILVLTLITQKISGKNFEQLATCLVGTVYIAPLLYYLVLIRLLPGGPGFIIILGIGTGIRDLGAMISGRILQSGHTILPAVSPKKTYEGAFGGLVFTILAVTLSSRWLIPSWGLGDALTMSLLIAVFGQLGDLVESWFKRNANVVDSSQILPGQGGVLDSFDSFILTAPIMYLYIVLRMLMR
jgi:phosphatidate cytidylyltransferase